MRELERLGLLEKVENHRHAVGHCYRCGTVIEPRLSETGLPEPEITTYQVHSYLTQGPTFAQQPEETRIGPASLAEAAVGRDLPLHAHPGTLARAGGPDGAREALDRRVRRDLQRLAQHLVPFPHRRPAGADDVLVEVLAAAQAEGEPAVGERADRAGLLRHDGGVVDAPGLYALGLTFLRPEYTFSIAAALLFGLRIWPAIAVGAFLVNVTTTGSIGTSTIDSCVPSGPSTPPEGKRPSPSASRSAGSVRGSATSSVIVL